MKRLRALARQVAERVLVDQGGNGGGNVSAGDAQIQLHHLLQNFWKLGVLRTIVVLRLQVTCHLGISDGVAVAVVLVDQRLEITHLN